ncbi:hypothetical protein JCM11491_003667 [Sporobolomyces phaffii]
MVTCRYFNSPGGCNRGASCHFQHDSSARRPPQRGGHASQPPSSRSQYVPKGICREFYLTGSCHNFATAGGCRYRHTQSKPVGGGRGPGAGAAPLEAGPRRPGLDTPEALTSAAKGVNSDAISPASSHLRVDRAILFKVANEVDFKFLEPQRVYPWVNSLYASTQVKALRSTHEESQNVLADLANPDGPGMARLVEVLNFPFSCDVGESSTSKSLSFQRGFMPLVFYLTSGEIRNSVFTHHLNRIYNVLHIHARSWVPSTLTCLDAIMVEKSVKDPRLFGGRSVGIAPEDFVQVFSPLTQVLHEYLTRFPDAIVKTPQVPQLVSTLETHFTTYYEAVCSNSTAYDPELTKDPRQHRFLVEGVRQSVNTLAKVIERTQIVPFVAAVPTARLTTIPSIAALAALKRLFEPPGALRTGGPRHDNDHASIKDIQILPTHQELLSREPAFVPANLPDGPHHLPLGSMDRQIDITFRLLREDFVGPLRAAVSSIVNDLGDLGNPRNALGNLLKRGGGRYRPSSSVHADSSDLNVYARVEFAGITLSNYHELQLELELDFPRNFGRSHVARHLAQGNLVGLICRRRGAGGDRRGTVNPNDVRIFLGLVTNEAHSAPGGVGRKRVGISFFEGELYLEALSQFEAQKKGRTDHGEMICFEVPGFLLGTLKPFLKALQGIEPASVPFAKYLSALPPPADDPITIEPPLFARTPGFVYDLSGSLTDKSPPGTLVLDINDEESVRAARQVLLESSRLDPSQIEALLDTSRREVALIRGPPGTGKSFLGVEIIRTLVQARIGLILILAYTNHALDTMLRHCKADVTDKIVRAGSRSQDPEMAEYNLNQLAFEQSRHQGRINHETRDLLNERKDLQKAIKAVCALSTRIARHDIEFEHLAEYLRLEFGEHLGQLRTVPASVTAASEQLGDGEWRIATGNRHAARSISVPTLSRDVFAWWRDGRDVEVLERAQDERDGVSAALARQHDEWAHHAGSNRFDVLGSRDSDDDGSESSASSSLDSDYGGLGSMFELFEDARIDSGSSDADSEDVTEEEEEEHDPRYVAPSRNRPLAELEADSDVWNYSLDERARILEAWADDLVRQEGPRINDLRRKQEDVNARLKALNNDAKLRVLQGAEIVGATTNSASNLLEIIAAAGPVVLVVEEAGECLETQVVANLVPSIQQLVMIGDEKQLRPQISSYHLSIDSSQGSVHRHDVSLFERLATLPVPVSMLRTQRRMRPEISALVRNFLYPDLEDAPQVHEYPDVKGMTKNVFFVDHRLAEDSQAIDHSSKTNTQEAIWVVDLVRHLLKQGYRAGQIAVICPYLGQLSALKRELEKETISVAIDERDAEDLAAAKEQAGVGDDSSDEDDEGEVEARFAPVQATMQTLKSQIDLRTIDRFQGEEADIVILSLTRNSASLSQEDEPTFYNLDRAAKSSIGFLKSFNRTNVAVSRAKHGMYLFGDAQLLAEKSQMWKSIVGQLEEQDLVGSRLPVGCVNHPETAFAIDAPGKLPELAPEGGCLERCNSQLPCGHACPRLCHALDPECATPDRRGNVVDFILMTTLGDFDEADPDPLSKLITVDCGHSLSIETLDGLFEIDLFYVKDEEGKIVGLAHPETSDKVPARCPSCKTAITSNVVKRYGRSLKHREATVQAFVESVPKTKILESARNFKVTSFGKVLVPVNVAKENQRRFLKKCDYPLIPSGLYHDKNFTGLPSTLHNFWTSKTRQVISGLYRLGQAGSRQSPQSKAYQAAITQLYFEEKDRLLASNEPVRDLDRSALEYAHRSAGMAPPTVDIKLQVQHVWLSLDLRSTLASFAAQLAEVVWKHRPEKGPVHQALVNLAGFVYKCSLRDVEHTIDLAESRSCGRLAIEGRLRRLQVLLAYNAFLSRSQLAYNFASRPTVLKVIEKAKQQALSDFDSAVDQFAAEQPLNRGWIDEEILPNRDNICKQWNGLLQSAREATVYEPVTEEELKIVIQSQKFATSSHWYTCPNGHSYAIGDCSGAVVEARCHECSAVIGGTGHRVSEGNHHDERMIRLAEQAGARPEFSWGRQ